jgi:hypothetical protein
VVREHVYRGVAPRDTTTGDRVDGVSTNSDPCSTHPLNPRALMRRHVPCDSPSWTRECGPIDATSRVPFPGPARTTTHPLDTELTQRADDRALGRGDGVAARAAPAIAASGDDDAGAGTGMAVPLGLTSMVSGDAAGRTRSLFAVMISFGSGVVSGASLEADDATVSTGEVGRGLGACCAVARPLSTRFGRVSRSSQVAPINTTSAPMPAPFQMRGAIGAG